MTSSFALLLLVCFIVACAVGVIAIFAQDYRLFGFGEIKNCGSCKHRGLYLGLPYCYALSSYQILKRSFFGLCPKFKRSSCR